MLDERMVMTVQFAGHGGGVGGGDLVMEGDAMRGGDMIHTVEAPHEIEMPPTAAELAVGDDMQAGGLLLGDELGDEPILDGLQAGGVDGARGEIGAGLLSSAGRR